MEKIKFSFDDEFKIRGFDAERFSKTDELQRQSLRFSEELTKVSDKATSVVDALRIHTQKIDYQKLKVSCFLFLVVYASFYCNIE